MSFDRDQLVKICGMFDSANAGERANAALKATRLVQAAGKAWNDIIEPPSTSVPERSRAHRDFGASFHGIFRWFSGVWRPLFFPCR